ncbi:unnamed protein product [Effrenium voratum]|nr:unnamed protein product [Effrenium voratum]
MMKISTSDNEAYSVTEGSLTLVLKWQDASVLQFDHSLSNCKDIIVEVWQFPAPASCATTSDGSAVSFTFYDDHTLGAATTYILMTAVHLQQSGGTDVQRTCIAQIIRDFELIDQFGVVIPQILEAQAGPQLGFFDITPMSLSLNSATTFTLEISLASSSEAFAIDPGAQGSIVIWAAPFFAWDFVQPCAVDASTESSSVQGRGTCTFLRYPDVGDAEIRAAVGFNSIKLMPSEKIGLSPVMFRFQVSSPSTGSFGDKWYAQALKADRPMQAPLSSPGLSIPPRPAASITQVSSAAAGADSTMSLAFETGISFSRGRLIFSAPLTFDFIDAQMSVSGFARVGTNAILSDNTLKIEVVDEGIWSNVLYAVILHVRNPATAMLSVTCVESLLTLVDDSLLGTLAASPFTMSDSEAWHLQIEVGNPVETSGSASITPVDMHLSMPGVISPLNYAVGRSNTLEVSFELVLGVLSSDAAIVLSGPAEFSFACSTFTAATSLLTVLPLLAPSGCTASNGYLSLALAHGVFLAAGTLLSFQISLENPSLLQAVDLESRLQSSAFAVDQAWMLSIQSNGVSCQASRLKSPHGAWQWQLFVRELSLQALFTGALPGAEDFVALSFEFSARVLRGSRLHIFAPVGYTFLSNFSVDDTAPDRLVVGFSEIGEYPNELVVPLEGHAFEHIVYGLHGTVRNALATPGSQEPGFNRWSLWVQVPDQISSVAALQGRAEAGTLVGGDLQALRACGISPSTTVFGWQNQLAVTFFVATSIYSSDASLGSVHVVAPQGFSFPVECIVSGLPASLGSTSTCKGNGNRAIVRLTGAIPRGPLVEFFLELVNPTEAVVGHWTIATYQGLVQVEECEQKVASFDLTRALNQALMSRAVVGQDLRPGYLSVYQFVFAYPERTAEELADIAGGDHTRSIVKVTCPVGFVAPAACLNGASGAGTGFAALPDVIACISLGRTLDITLQGLITPLTTYALSVTVQNPPQQQSNQWTLLVDRATATLEGPALRVLQDVSLMPGSMQEAAFGICMIHFRTVTAVPINGQLDVNIPASFTPRCPAALYDTGVAALGKLDVTPGTPCLVTASGAHRLTLGPLTVQLESNTAYLLALGLENGLAAFQEATSSTWTVTTQFEGEMLDVSRPLSSFDVRPDFGTVRFTPPALVSPRGQPYPVDVTFTLATAVRSGAVVFYPPPYTLGICQDLPTDGMPQGATCKAEGDATGWRSQRIMLRSLSPWSSRPYYFQLLVQDAGEELPEHRSYWTVELVASVQLSQTEDSDPAALPNSNSLPSLPGFVVGSRSVEQWRWRGWLDGLSITSMGAAQGASSQALVSFVSQLELFPADEVWVRAPAGIVLQPFSCFVSTDGNIRIPVPCEVPEPTAQCFPSVHQTEPCVDAGSGLSPDSPGFSHRIGMKLRLGRVVPQSSLQILLAFVPLVAADPGKWLVSTWRANQELEAAIADGFSIWHWIEVTQFRPSSLLPEADISVHVAFWMLSPLEFGGIQIHSPSNGIFGALFDLSQSVQGFSWGNLPQNARLQKLTTSTAVLQVHLCCELLGRTEYFFNFGAQNPSMQRMPATSQPELNTWALQTVTPEDYVKHYRAVPGYQLARGFRKSSVTLEDQLVVGGVEGSADRMVNLVFYLPHQNALHRTCMLRLLAPTGWNFPDKCELNLQLGAFTTVTSCTAAQNELTLLVSGDLNPGIEGKSFGFEAAVKLPTSAAENDVWFLEAYGAAGTPDTLVDPNRYDSLDFELAPRLASPLLGTGRDASATLEGQISAQVQLSLEALESRSTWRLPSYFLAAVRLHLPALPSRLVNATLLVSFSFHWAQLRCSRLPRPFQSGSLPAGALCSDASSTGAPGALEDTQVIIAFDNIIPLRSGSYNFTLVVLTLPRESPSIVASAWPRESAWSLSLGTGSFDFRTTLASVQAVEGRNTAVQTIRDLGLVTSNSQRAELTQIDILLHLEARRTLPMAIEIEPPSGFQLDTSPSPLHPALQSSELSNPFRWQRDWSASQIRSGEYRQTNSSVKVPCPFFELMLDTPEFKEVVSDTGQSGICTSLWSGGVGTATFAVCMEDAYTSLPRTQVQCHVLAGKAVLEISEAIPKKSELSWLTAGLYRLSLRGYNPPEPHLDESPHNSWRVSIASKSNSLVPALNVASSSVARGSVPNFILEDTLGPTTIWRGTSWTADTDVQSIDIVTDDVLSPTRVVQLT